ncbi:MAG: dockerin type I repeat-containing protein [Clostridia bacterium]|nr:dockerin type I repeat-containing protein [Clostridia bacterium]
MKKILSVIIIISVVLSMCITAFAATVKPGDVNGDGSITAGDARTVLRISAQLESCDENTLIIADVNSDGAVTAGDARTILRISAQLENELPEITIGGGEELSESIGMTLSKFIEKYGALEAVGTSDGTKTYRNSEITVVSDPKMIGDDKISSITVTGGSYVVNGISVGMLAEDAKAQLSADKWTLKSSNDTTLTYSKDGLVIKLTVKDGAVTKIVCGLAYSLTGDDNTSDGGTDEAPDNTDDTNADYISVEELPEAAQYFLNGKFGLDGAIYSDGVKNEVSMYTDSSNINMSMIMDMGEGVVVDLTILMLDEGNSEMNLYMLNNDNKKYVELTDSTFSMLNSLTGGSLNISKNDFKFDFHLNDPSTLKITQTETVDGGVTYTVYKAKGQKNITNLYFAQGELTKVITTDFYGNVITTIEINELLYPLPENCFSYKNYKSTGLTTLFDFDSFV